MSERRYIGVDLHRKVFTKTREFFHVHSQTRVSPFSPESSSFSNSIPRAESRLFTLFFSAVRSFHQPVARLRETGHLRLLFFFHAHLRQKCPSLNTAPGSVHRSGRSSSPIG